MAKALPTGISRGRVLDWRKRMSDNVAYALLVYTALQIFVTTQALRETGSSALPMMALVVLVAAIIPWCRRFEKRWESIGEANACDPQLKPRFRRDQIVLWALAIGLPFVLTGLCKALIGTF
jgi:hypothetical protein